jgi:hypothetical protein
MLNDTFNCKLSVLSVEKNVYLQRVISRCKQQNADCFFLQCKPISWCCVGDILMMEAASTSETLVIFHQTTRHYNPEDGHHKKKKFQFTVTLAWTPTLVVNKMWRSNGVWLHLIPARKVYILKCRLCRFAPHLQMAVISFMYADTNYMNIRLTDQKACALQFVSHTTNVSWVVISFMYHISLPLYAKKY